MGGSRLAVRVAVLADAAAIGRIRAPRMVALGMDGAADLDRHERWVRRMVESEEGERLLLVAEEDGAVVGYALAAWFEPPEDAPANAAPAGWYLLGVVVEPGFRRRGIGRALTEARMRWLAERTHEVWYFRDVDNLASDALHARWSFEPVTEDFWFPGTFDPDSRMVLLKARLHPAQ